MLRLGVLVSGGGTNLQALIDAIASGQIRNTEIAAVISNNAGAYALERARLAGVKGVCISPKDYTDRDAFHRALLKELQESKVDLVVLAGPLVVQALLGKSGLLSLRGTWTEVMGRPALVSLPPKVRS